jgi:hypothetical protein
VKKVVEQIRSLQRQRTMVIKSRIMQENRLVAHVADTLGYSSRLTAKERQEMFAKGAAVVRQVNKVDDLEAAVKIHPYAAMIHATKIGVAVFDKMIRDFERKMTNLVKGLPVAEWIEQPDQRGFGLLTAAIVLGECGDLGEYANPGKVWRRMGCAPWRCDDKTLMGATWKAGKEGKLSGEEWTDYGYSPRRRSIAYLIGTNIVRSNFVDEDPLETEGYDEDDPDCETERPHEDGPYRRRYEEAKAKFAQKHADQSEEKWFKLRCHLHGMLLAAKMFLLNLWVEWNR